MAFQISFCPYRVSINDWSSIQETQFSTPVVFRGDARDLQKLDDCNEELVRQRKEKTEADRLLAEAEAAEAARQVAIEQEEAERLAAIAQEEADRQAAIEKEEADQRALIEREQAEQEAALEKEEVDRAALASAEVQAAEPVAVEDTGDCTSSTSGEGASQKDSPPPEDTIDASSALAASSRSPSIVSRGRSKTVQHASTNLNKTESISKSKTKADKNKKKNSKKGTSKATVSSTPATASPASSIKMGKANKSKKSKAKAADIPPAPATPEGNVAELGVSDNQIDNQDVTASSTSATDVIETEGNGAMVAFEPPSSAVEEEETEPAICGQTESTHDSPPSEVVPDEGSADEVVEPAPPDDESLVAAVDEAPAAPADESAAVPDEESPVMPENEVAVVPDDESVSAAPVHESAAAPVHESAAAPEEELAAALEEESAAASEEALETPANDDSAAALGFVAAPEEEEAQTTAGDESAAAPENASTAAPGEDEVAAARENGSAAVPKNEAPVISDDESVAAPEEEPAMEPAGDEPAAAPGDEQTAAPQDAVPTAVVDETPASEQNASGMTEELLPEKDLSPASILAGSAASEPTADTTDVETSEAAIENAHALAEDNADTADDVEAPTSSEDATAPPVSEVSGSNADSLDSSTAPTTEDIAPEPTTGGPLSDAAPEDVSSEPPRKEDHQYDLDKGISLLLPDNEPQEQVTGGFALAAEFDEAPAQVVLEAAESEVFNKPSMAGIEPPSEVEVLTGNLIADEATEGSGFGRSEGSPSGVEAGEGLADSSSTTIEELSIGGTGDSVIEDTHINTETASSLVDDSAISSEVLETAELHSEEISDTEISDLSSYADAKLADEGTKDQVSEEHEDDVTSNNVYNQQTVDTAEVEATSVDNLVPEADAANSVAAEDGVTVAKPNALHNPGDTANNGSFVESSNETKDNGPSLCEDQGADTPRGDTVLAEAHGKSASLGPPAVETSPARIEDTAECDAPKPDESTTVVLPEASEENLSTSPEAELIAISSPADHCDDGFQPVSGNDMSGNTQESTAAIGSENTGATDGAETCSDVEKADKECKVITRDSAGENLPTNASFVATAVIPSETSRSRSETSLDLEVSADSVVEILSAKEDACHAEEPPAIDVSVNAASSGSGTEVEPAEEFEGPKGTTPAESLDAESPALERVPVESSDAAPQSPHSEIEVRPVEDNCANSDIVEASTTDDNVHLQRASSMLDITPAQPPQHPGKGHDEEDKKDADDDADPIALPEQSKGPEAPGEAQNDDIEARSVMETNQSPLGVQSTDSNESLEANLQQDLVSALSQQLIDTETKVATAQSTTGEPRDAQAPPLDSIINSDSMVEAEQHQALEIDSPEEVDDTGTVELNAHDAGIESSIPPDSELAPEEGTFNAAEDQLSLDSAPELNVNDSNCPDLPITIPTARDDEGPPHDLPDADNHTTLFRVPPLKESSPSRHEYRSRRHSHHPRSSTTTGSTSTRDRTISSPMDEQPLRSIPLVEGPFVTHRRRSSTTSNLQDRFSSRASTRPRRSDSGFGESSLKGEGREAMLLERSNQGYSKRQSGDRNRDRSGRRYRTPDEQAAHDLRKAERRARAQAEEARMRERERATYRLSTIATVGRRNTDRERDTSQFVLHDQDHDEMNRDYQHHRSRRHSSSMSEPKSLDKGVSRPTKAVRMDLRAEEMRFRSVDDGGSISYDSRHSVGSSNETSQRKKRTPEQQARHDARKEERRRNKAKDAAISDRELRLQEPEDDMSFRPRRNANTTARPEELRGRCSAEDVIDIEDEEEARRLRRAERRRRRAVAEQALLEKERRKKGVRGFFSKLFS